MALGSGEGVGGTYEILVTSLDALVAELFQNSFRIVQNWPSVESFRS